MNPEKKTQQRKSNSERILWIYALGVDKINYLNKLKSLTIKEIAPFFHLNTNEAQKEKWAQNKKSHVATSGGLLCERELSQRGAFMQQMLTPKQVASDDGAVLIRLKSLQNHVIIAT